MTRGGSRAWLVRALHRLLGSATARNRMQDIAFRIRFVRGKGIAWALERVGSRLLGLALCVALLPVTLVLHLLGFRHVDFVTDRIGHLALEPDCLLKEQALGRIPRRRWIFLAPAGQVANAHLLEYWKPHFLIVRNPAACYLIRSMRAGRLMGQDVSRYLRAFGETQEAYRIYAEWGDRPPLLQLSAEDDAWGREMLGRLGLPEGAWFAAVHVREAGFSQFDEVMHSHRNGAVENVVPAMEEITRRGGWAIRIGDPTMRRLPPMPRVVDYAHHPAKSPRMDVFLCARSRFILGNTSGIALLGTIFGVPCAVANAIPPSTLWFNPADLSIPKLIWSKDLGRYLRFDEMLASPLSVYHHAFLYDKERMVPVENSGEDIRALAAEMLDRLEGAFATGEDDERMLRFVRGLFRPGHDGYGSPAQVAVSFLRSNRHVLLPEEFRPDRGTPPAPPEGATGAP